MDMFLKENGKVILNEINTMPGMTSYSRYPRMMAAAGLSLAEVIDRIVSSAKKMIVSQFINPSASAGTITSK